MYYSIEDFNEILSNGINYILEDEVINKIKELEILINVPQYDLQTKPIKKYFEKKKIFEKDKKFYSSNEITNDDWQLIRNFKPTTIEVKDGIEKQINDIRILLNKISSKNYESYKNTIISDITLFMENNTNEDDHKRIVKIIFDIVSSNKFYSVIYADLYKELIKQFSIFNDELLNFISSFKSNFHNINYIDPNIDYDGFCNYTKQNDNRKAIVTFICNMVKNEMLAIGIIIDIIIYLQDLMLIYIKEKNRTNEVEEITENIFIFITQCYKLFDSLNCEEWLIIKNNILVFSTMKIKDNISLTNRSIFKHLDILDTIKK